MNLEKSLVWGGYQIHRVQKLITKKSVEKYAYNGKNFLNPEEANEWIGDAIEGNDPFMVGRYGSNELSALWKVKNDGSGFECNINEDLEKMHFNAGLFPKSKDVLLEFATEMKEATAQVDLMGVWNQLMEEYELKQWGNDPEYCKLRSLEPFWVDNPWSAHLAGKKVLIIHPFAKTIQQQYLKHDKLFSNPNILPDFELIVQKAVQTIAGNKDERFETWFEALEYMEKKALMVEFDVAIIGCGAYGFPLASRLKKAGKKAIHLGGATQLLFGIRGSRWEEREDYKSMMHDSWVRPLEKPHNSDRIENGCYW